ncbi:MAG: hypothetical protein H0X65_00320 [Gemmatimonadetes bacterium]|nr:hypothetical protein [Gemmatimonadota bacterium]
MTRGKAKKAGFVLYYKPNIPIALIEAKDNRHGIGDGMQRALGSMTEFKQIVGRGTRVHEDTKKFYFTLIDFHGTTCSRTPTTT